MEAAEKSKKNIEKYIFKVIIFIISFNILFYNKITNRIQRKIHIQLVCNCALYQIRNSFLFQKIFQRDEKNFLRRADGSAHMAISSVKMKKFPTDF